MIRVQYRNPDMRLTLWFDHDLWFQNMHEALRFISSEQGINEGRRYRVVQVVAMEAEG
jgi:hypothetical protein